MSELTKVPPLVSSNVPELPAETSAILRIFGRNTLWLWLDLGALRMGTMLAGIFLIRYFGPSNFGIYSMALAVGWLLNAVIDLGLTRYTARAVAATPKEVHPILALTLLTTIVSAILTLVVLLISLRMGHYALACFSAGFVLCNLEGTSSLCSSVLTAELRSRAILPGSILGATGLITLTALTIWLHLSVLALLVCLCFKSFAVVSLRLWQLRSSWPAADDWTWNRFWQLTQNAWPYFRNNLTQVGYGRVAILCLGFVSTQVAVGWFAAAYTISDVIPQWSYAFSGAILPVWTRLYETGRIDELLSLTRRLWDMVLFATIPVWILMAVYGLPICRLLGQQYIPSATVLRLVAIRCVLAVLDGFLGHGFLVAVDRVSQRQWALARSLVLLAILSIAFGSLWGAVGVALALLISDLSLILQYVWIISRIPHKIEWPSLSPVVSASILMAVCAMVLPEDIPVVLRAAAALMIYLLGLLILSKERVIGLGQTLRECIAR
jgi:O-antigen/teichoic acid export membrane protein